MCLVINAFAASWGIVWNQQLLRETESMSITNIVHQRQLWLCGHVARYPESDPASRVVSERDNPGWRTPTKFMARQVDASCLSYLVWEGGLHGVITGAGVGWLARGCVHHCMTLMID